MEERDKLSLCVQNFVYLIFYYSIERSKKIMGCEQSKLVSGTDIDEDVPQKAPKTPNRKKNVNGGIQGRHSQQKIFENVTRIDLPKTPEDLQFIQKTISHHFLLFKLSRQERRQIANAMNAYQTEEKQYVFQQGTPASMFFIIQEGSVQIQIKNQTVKTLTKGEFFGELALLYSAPRSASVKTLTKCTFWCLSQHLFLKIQREMVKSNYRLAKPLVHKLPLFSFLSNKQKDGISYNVNSLKYGQNEFIFKEGDDAASFFIIISGLVEIRIPGKNPIKFKNGDSFGQNCLKPNQIRSGSAICLEKTELLSLGREDLKLCLGDKSLEELLFHNIVKWSLKRSQIFKGMSSFDESKLISLGDFVYRRNEEVLIEAGDIDDKIYVCLEGKISDFEVGTIINETEALNQDVETFNSEHTLTKKEAGYVFSIPLKLIQKEKSKEKKKNLDTLRKIESKRQLVQHHRPSATNLKVDFKDLYVICKLGEGQMGKVYLVENKKTQKLYALKCVQKNIVLKHEMEKFLKCEKEILQIIDSPFIVKLYETYKDSHFVYLLMTYIEGGDFFDFLSEIGICSNASAAFYLGCLIQAIQYLHKSSIVYRDLKPENVVVDSNGYLKLIDMGTAKLLHQDSQTGFRTFTIIGTPHYMAPEVMEAKGYSFSVDIWSLGIILYQMVCGVLPYGGYTDDPVTIYKEIEKNDLKFPKSYTDPSGKLLISRLLQKHPERRAVHDFSEIKHMDFFGSFNWHMLSNQKMNAPIKPKIPENKLNNKGQYLLVYLQKQKLKMEKPITPKNMNWDQIF